MTDGASLPNNESINETLEQSNQESKNFVFQSIDDRLKQMSEFSITCQSEALASSNRKRTNRWISAILGVLTAITGVSVTTISDIFPLEEQANLRTNIITGIGIFNIILGSVVTTAGQYLDPKKSRQRAIDLKHLAIKIENFAEEKKIAFLSLKNEPANFDKLVDLNTTLRDNFTEFQKEAFENGVDV